MRMVRLVTPGSKVTLPVVAVEHDGLAVCGHLRDGVAHVREVGYVLIPGIGEVANHPV